MFGIPGPHAVNAHNTFSVIVTTQMPTFAIACCVGSPGEEPLELNDP